MYTPWINLKHSHAPIPPLLPYLRPTAAIFLLIPIPLSVQYSTCPFHFLSVSILYPCILISFTILLLFPSSISKSPHFPFPIPIQSVFFSLNPSLSSLLLPCSLENIPSTRISFSIYLLLPPVSLHHPHNWLPSSLNLSEYTILV